MDLFYKALSVLSGIVVSIGLIANLTIIVYIALLRQYRSKNLFFIFLAINNFLIYLSWDYTIFLQPFYLVNYMLFSALWCRVIVFLQYWSKQWHAWILVVMTSDVYLANGFATLYKKVFNWKGKLVTMCLVSIMFFLLNLHLAIIDFKYIKFKFENKTYVKKVQCLDMSYSWIRLHAIGCCYAPCVIIIALNISILIQKLKLRKEQNKIMPQKLVSTTVSKVKKESEKYPVSVYVANVMFILLTTPDITMFFSYVKPINNNPLVSELAFTQHMLNFVSLIYYSIHMLFFIGINYKNRKIVF